MKILTGVDILEIKRIKKLIKKTDFLDRFFTKKEREYFKNRNFRPDVIAGRFAAKEAVSKALGTGISGFSFADIEVLPSQPEKTSSSPVVNLLGKARLALERSVEGDMYSAGDAQISLSISHSKKSAVAFATILLR